MTSPSFNFLHFCDFHIGGARGPQAVFLTSMVDQVSKACVEHNTKISAVFLTGDLSYSGKASEFETFAAHFLEPLMRIPLIVGASVYAVPGNHDVDCDESLPITWEGIHKRNQELFFCEDSDGVKVRKSRSTVFTAYWNFIEKYKIKSPNPFKEVGILDSSEDWPFDVLATNTAFFSDKNEQSSLPITPAPLASLQHLAKPGSRSRPLFVFAHHPIGCFLPDHGTQLDTFIFDRKAVLFHGHEHSPKVTFNRDGSLKTLGFGASYVATMGTPTHGPYVNSFTLCQLNAQLRLRCYSWQSFPGTWVDSTTTNFHQCIVKEDGADVAQVNVSLISPNRPAGTDSRPIAYFPRATSRPTNIIPLGDVSTDVWNRLFSISENLQAIFRRETLPRHTDLPDADGKRCVALESDDGRHLVIVERGVSHVLSAKEIESFNTRLDTEDYRSLTVLSFGKIAEDARLMYVRLKARKKLEVLVNQNFTAAADLILSNNQVQVLQGLEAGSHSVSILAGEQDVYLLIVKSGPAARAFQIIDSNGATLLPSDPIVANLRAASPELEDCDYYGVTGTSSQRGGPAFDEASYKASCYREYNNIRYAALANFGVRISDLPLEDLYVAATANEVGGEAGNRLGELVDDYLASYEVSDELRQHIQKQLLSTVSEGSRTQSSRAREFCQKYPAVLLTGDPGSGKTCFVKNEILAYCKARVSNPKSDAVSDWHAVHIPILVQLSELVGESDLESSNIYILTSRLLSRHGFYFPERDLETLVKQGRIAWFFDGLDEIVSVEKRAFVVQIINDLVQGVVKTGNRLVVTSRPAAVHVVNLLPALKKLEIQGLTKAEIRVLAARVLRLKLTTSGEKVIIHDSTADTQSGHLVDQLLLDCEQKPGVARLAQNPLLLTLLIMIYANSGAPSAKRHVIYEKAVETLAEVRGREAGHMPISTQDLRERLGAVALSVYKKESGLLPTRKEVCEVIRNVMSRQKGKNVTYAEANAFVQRVAESTGLVAVETRHGQSDESAVVTFMHHSFLEYFAAVGLGRDLNNVDVAALVSQPRWHEILTLLAGIIGEIEDIAPVLNRILESPRDTADVDAKLLLFAMDCALECDIPSEAAQHLICGKIENCLKNGPARLDPWIRSEIGQRAAQLFTACGGLEFDQMMIDLLERGTEDVCAATIGVLCYCYTSGYHSDALTQAFNRSCTRTEDMVLSAIATSAGRSRELRSDAALQVIGRNLTKSQRRKQAAFEALGNIPSLAAVHWAEVINGMDDTNKRTSRLAAIAAVQAGLNADLITLGGSKKDVLVKALRTFDETGAGDGRSTQLKKETVQQMLGSVLSVDRLIGIQVLPMSDADGPFVFENLMGIIRAKSDRQEVCAALWALRLCSDALAVFKQSDLRAVADLMKTGTSDVRQAAARLLGSFGEDVVAVESLLDISYADLYSEEYAVCIFALSQARVQLSRVTAFLYDELEQLSGEYVKWTDENATRLRAVLGALRRSKATGPTNLVNRVRALAEDPRIDDEIRRAALLCYPSIAIPSQAVVEHIAKWIKIPAIGMDLELVQVPSILAARCRESVDYVAAAIKALIGFRVDLIEFHARISKRPPSEHTEFYTSELRKGIGEVSEIVVSFEELMYVSNGKRP